MKRLTNVSGFLNAIRTDNLGREKREFDVQAVLIRQTLAAPINILVLKMQKLRIWFRFIEEKSVQIYHRRTRKTWKLRREEVVM